MTSLTVMNIGAHVRGGGKLVPSLEEGVDIGATSIQVFVQSPRMWKPTQYAPDVLEGFRAAQAAHPTVTSTWCHATYLINLASSDRDLYERSVDCLTNNLSVSRGMGVSGVVLHVGSHMGVGFEQMKGQIADGLRRALDGADVAPVGVGECPILIENAAGTGGTVGSDFGEIEAIIAACGGDERLGLCVDTQHLWASGVDYSTVAGAERFLNSIDERIGLARLKCLHFNDSKIELGGNRDRHANIDEGTIGAVGLAPLVGHPAIRELPLLLEVPGDGGGPRGVDVVSARKVVAQGIALYDGAEAAAAALEAVSLIPINVMSPPVKTTAKKAPAKKAPANKVTANKVTAKKVTAKKTTAKKAAKKTAKKTSKKVTAKKAAKKAPIKKVAKKVATKTAKKTAKKAAAKKTAAKKAPMKKSAKKSAKKASAKKVAKRVAKKSAAKKSLKKAAKKAPKKQTGKRK